MTLSDPDHDVLLEWTPKLVDALHAVPGLRDVVDDLQGKGLQTALVIDRDAAARLGVNNAAIDDALYDAFGQRQIRSEEHTSELQSLMRNSYAVFRLQKKTK